MPHVALATCDRLLPAGDPDDELLTAACAAAGLEVTLASWSDPAVRWDEFDLTVLRSTWDYSGRRSEFLRWLDGVPRLHNPAAIVGPNTDKAYLVELAAAGLPVIPSTLIPPGQSLPEPVAGEYVIKPTVGAGSKGAGRFDTSVAEDADRAAEHLAQLHAAGHVALLQPYIASVDDVGETAMIFIDGAFSHAIGKQALLPSGTRHPVGGYQLYVAENIAGRQPSAAEQAVARAVYGVISAHSSEPLLYARIDLVAGPDGPLLIEAELTEPSLFLAHHPCDADHPGAAEALATAIVGRCR